VGIRRGGVTENQNRMVKNKSKHTKIKNKNTRVCLPGLTISLATPCAPHGGEGAPLGLQLRDPHGPPVQLRPLPHRLRPGPLRLRPRGRQLAGRGRSIRPSLSPQTNGFCVPVGGKEGATPPRRVGPHLPPPPPAPTPLFPIQACPSPLKGVPEPHTQAATGLQSIRQRNLERGKLRLQSNDPR